MELKLSNWGKPSNKRIKLWADVLLYISPLLTPIIAGLEPVSATFSLWTVALLNMAVVIVKAISKFTVEEQALEVTPEEDKTTENGTETNSEN